MNILILLKGIAIGFSIAAVVGPIGILCIRRSISYGFVPGLATGTGAGLADASYAAIAAFGLTAISDLFFTYIFALKIIGGSYLMYLGITTLLSSPSLQTIPSDKIPSPSLYRTIWSTFLLTMTSPVTILAFISIFTAYGVEALSFANASTLTIGTFFGSMLWWLILSAVGSVIGKKLSVKKLSLVNKVSGTIILLFGIYTLTKIF